MGRARYVNTPRSLSRCCFGLGSCQIHYGITKTLSADVGDRDVGMVVEAKQNQEEGK